MQLMTKEQQEMFESTTTCHICGNYLGDDRVRDHNHLTGLFRGAAHNKCNINFKKPRFIPVFIHNLAGYDTHLFIKEFGKFENRISLIPNNEERYISFTVSVEGGIELRFIDSFKFMSQSLDRLAKNLTRSQFKHISTYYNGKDLNLLLRKGVYPYDYMDSIEKYSETSLPSQEEFYNRLNKQHITNEDYKHACDVWTAFNIQNMKEYTMLYNETDVLLLADVMENFRDVCLNTYKLDPAWYFTAPGLAWNAMLKITKVELSLLTDIDMVLMVEKGIRGGISQCSHRYAKANNPYMKDYDKSKPNNYLMYLDANNLYGWAMSVKLPYANFQWSSTDIDVMKVSDDSPTGYILEVDLEYPEELHDVHSDLPLAPERKVPPGSKMAKLLTTLYSKEKYVVHYKNLKLYLSLGMKLKHVHRVLSFSQSNWLQPYINLNTMERTKAKNDFEKDFFKLMNNSVFGKTMENMRNRVDIRLGTKSKLVERWVSKPNFKSRTIFTENLVAVHFSKKKLLLNKPIYVGMSILDISKTLMYDFHYNVMKEKYGSNIKMVYTDTDSLIYDITTKNFYEDMKHIIGLFDTSDYPNPNQYGLPHVNKKVLGKMKDELNGRIMREFVGLRSKMYASNIEDNHYIKRSKGVKKAVVENEITFSNYKDCLFSNIEHYKTMNTIRSQAHNLYSVEHHKVVLSSKDDKRFVLEDNIRTLAWGHHRICENC
uniref:DNA-directed DNA polymerase n=3 Tax=Homalodisca liturata TaxID=320908 RepID=A0A1B6JA38_9HEMI